MRVTSLGFRTDIALRALEGSQITEHPGYLAIRTPANPDFRWGNFLLLSEPPEPASASRWTETFAREFPAADYVALGIDVTRADQADTAGFARLGFRPQVTAVLTATDVRPPPRPNERASLRPLATDEDWRRAHEVALASNPGGPGHREFLERRMAEKRRLAESDGGAWFGAFDGGELLADLGVFRTEPGIARFQDVETHPAARRQGLAGTLVHHAARYALRELGVATLVMLAESGGDAIRIYRSVGFAQTQQQVSVECLTQG